MRLENVLKNFHPKSPTFSDSSHSTSPDRITGTDIMAAMGMTKQKAKFGMDAFLAKNDISEQDKYSTVEALTQYALRITPKLIRKAAGNKLGPCIVLLAKSAFEDYALSAGSLCECPDCKGKRLIYNQKEIIKHPGITQLDGTVIISPSVDIETVGECCQTCKGKGTLSNRCRCKGRGKVLDEEQTLLQGIEVMKTCSRCAGRGYKRVPSSVAYNAIKHLIPDLTQSSWSRNWKPFYEALTGKCYIEESTAEGLFSQITR